ncbi:hypothetical protein M5K25_024742 [Dendrobium thyrsiflorum]|uniref:Homeobox protein knotted-1-like 3 n=1 Tax=Dendrobium thyrsiflorum TaxID=117978 RepID=A0ABD0U308_DENTH
MAYHRHLAQRLTIPQYSENQLGENPAVIASIASELLGRTTSNVAGKTQRTIAGCPTWLNGAILRQQSQQFVDGSFLHLQTAFDSSTSPVAAGQWVPHRLFNGEEEVPVSSDSMIAAAMPDPVDGDGETVAGGGGGQQAVEGTWQNARYKAEILGHPLCEQLLSAHVACLRIATPVDQLPRIDAQLWQLQQVVAKYSVLRAEHGGQILACDDKELDHFMRYYALLLCSFKEQLQQHVHVHAREAVMACWELQQSLQSLTGVSSDEGIGATMSDDDDDDEDDSETNFFDVNFDGSNCMGFGPLIPTESERTLMERVRQELKHELKIGYKEKIVDIREEILRKRRAGKLPSDTTSTLKAWWQSHSKWPYPTEDDKARLVQETGLQLKQINNWFINQRKRNWHSNPSSSTTLKSNRKRTMKCR